MTRPLTRLTGKVEWRWTESEELAFQILRRVCATKAAMFGWDPKLPVDLYSDASNFAAGCYITQTQDGETRPLVYDSFTLLPAERNYDTYRRELAAIVKFTKKYSHMLNVAHQSVVHTDHKPLVGFLNAEYHEDIFARWANKLRLLNIRIQHIPGKKNTVADGLSRVIFNNADCSPDRLVSKLAKEVFSHQDDDEWFWKSGKGGYRDMLMQLTAEDRAIRIKQYGEEAVSAFPVGWTSFHRDPSPQSEYIILDAFHAAGIVVSGATQFQKMATRSLKGVPVDYSNDDWYADVYHYYTNQQSSSVDRVRYAVTKKQAQYYRYDSLTKRLLRQVGRYWAICLTKPEVAPILREVHDHAGHFGSKIVLDRLRFRVYWPKMAADIREYIRGCLPCAKWATSARSVPLTPIQTGEPYELMGMDFIGPFERSAYGNTYIYNLVDYFLRHMYPHPTAGAGTNDVILSFNHYLQANPKPYTVYMDAGSYFTSQKLCTYFQKKDIAVVFAPSASYKSVGLIEKSNNILQQAFKKIRQPGEEWEDALFYAISQVNSQMIEYLGYSPVKIITGIQPLTSIECKI